MALAQIIDLDERRRARQTITSSESFVAPAVASVVASEHAPAWCYVWMPIYFWYVT